MDGKGESQAIHTTKYSTAVRATDLAFGNILDKSQEKKQATEMHESMDRKFKRVKLNNILLRLKFRLK